MPQRHLETAPKSCRKVRLKRNELIKGTTTAVLLACLLASGCSSRANRNDAPITQATATAPDVAEGGLGLDLVNFTGASLRAVYISPNDSNGWEENVLGTDQLHDGDTVDIRFDSNETPALWDIKVESTKGNFAELKGLDLRGVSRITLLLKLVSKPTLVAEIE